MQRVVTASPLAEWLSADANLIQDRAEGLILGSDNNQITDVGARVLPGGLLWIYNAAITTTIVVIDKNVDWRDRHFHFSCHQLGDAQSVPGGTADHLYGNNALTITEWYSGSGGEKSGGGQVDSSNPPVQSGSIPSYAHAVMGTFSNGLLVYVDSFDSNKLKIMLNGAFTNVGFSMRAMVSGKLAKI